MKSIRDIYKTGTGPSSSHTMGSDTHPNTMDLYAFQKDRQIAKMRVFSIGGGLAAAYSRRGKSSGS